MVQTETFDRTDLFTFDRKYDVDGTISVEEALASFAGQAFWGSQPLRLEVVTVAGEDSETHALWAIPFAVQSKPDPFMGVSSLLIDCWLAVPPYVTICSPWVRLELWRDVTTGRTLESSLQFVQQ